MAHTGARQRRQAVSDLKRGLILDAARRMFRTHGLERASLRGIAAEAGYTPAALYFHFDSKEAIYAALLEESLVRLGDAIAEAAAEAGSDATRLEAAAMALFRFYAMNPHDLELGFYLYRGGVKPAGLGPDRDPGLNNSLATAIDPIRQAAIVLGANESDAAMALVDILAHATGLLVMAHTGRIRMFDASPEDRMRDYLRKRVAEIVEAID